MVCSILRVIDLQTEEEVRNGSVEVFQQIAGSKWRDFSSVSSLKSVHVSELRRSQGHSAKKSSGSTGNKSVHTLRNPWNSQLKTFMTAPCCVVQDVKFAFGNATEVGRWVIPQSCFDRDRFVVLFGM